MNLCDINYIRDLLNRNGFRFSRSMGQNFLIAPWVPMEIADQAGLDENTGVIEVGPGVGCLTVQLAENAKKVVSIELDTALKPVLKETLLQCENSEIVFGDALKLNLKELVAEKLPNLKAVVCANLPYNITSPLLTAFIEADCFESFTVMVQREVALRICADAGTKDYGAFSVYANWHTEPEILFDVEPECFIPAPKVTSSVIKLTVRKKPPVEVMDEKFMFKIVRASFNQRRKTLVNGINSALPHLSKELIIEALKACGLDERVRGETLDIYGFAKLSDELLKLAEGKEA